MEPPVPGRGRRASADRRRAPRRRARLYSYCLCYHYQYYYYYQQQQSLILRIVRPRVHIKSYQYTILVHILVHILVLSISKLGGFFKFAADVWSNTQCKRHVNSQLQVVYIIIICIIHVYIVGIHYRYTLYYNKHCIHYMRHVRVYIYIYIYIHNHN